MNDKGQHRHNETHREHDHGHEDEHGHGHAHSHAPADASDGRLALSLLLNLGITLAEVVGGLLGNLFTAWLLHADSKQSLNIRSAYLHIVMDTLSSVGVIAAAILVMLFGWLWLDPLLTLLVSLYVLWESFPLLKTSIRIPMQGTPEGIPVERIIAEAEAVADVKDMHHVHIWTTDGTEIFLEAHITVAEAARNRTDRLLSDLSEHIREHFGIAHVTLQFEFDCCVGGRCSGLDAVARKAASIR